MIVAHCFSRKIKNKWYLMCETSVTEDVRGVYSTPEVMFEFDPGEADTKTMAKRVSDRILAMRPDLEFDSVLQSAGKSEMRPVTFDLAFRVRPMGLSTLFGMTKKGKVK